MSERVQFIKENSEMTNIELCRNLGIHEEYLNAICEWHGIDRNKDWSEPELQVLRDFYKTASFNRIRRELKKHSDRYRSNQAIKTKAQTMGLNRIVTRGKSKPVKV